MQRPARDHSITESARSRIDCGILMLRSHIEQSKLEVRKISIHRLHMARLEAGPRRAGNT